MADKDQKAAGMSDDDALLMTARERLQTCMTDDEENRSVALDDLKFVADAAYQWPSDIRTMREADNRPCISVNKMPTFLDQVVGDQRQNRPGLKAFPVDNKGDVKVAGILSGWFKGVMHASSGDAIIDHAFEHSAACGYGAWRVVTRYADSMSFNQDAYLEKIDNALSVWWGPHKNYDCSDAMYCFIVNDMPREDYKAQYPGDDPMPFNTTDSRYIEGWCTDKTVRLCEYYVKEPQKSKLYLFKDGTTATSIPENYTQADVVKQRDVVTYKIMWYLLTGNEIKDRKEWAGKQYIPVVPVWGKELNVGGKRYVRGLVRNAKDPQRMYNYFLSVDTEAIALQPKAPFILTPKQLGEHKSMWMNANRTNQPYLLVDPDQKAPGWPQRQAPIQASNALTQKTIQADQDIRDTMGLQKASLGMTSNERSGKAILERKKEGDTGTFAFFDNLVRSLEYTGRILLDIAPTILDTERIITMGLDDGTYKPEAINVPGADGKTLHNIQIGQYDIVVKVGPSFTTQRSESRQSMGEFIQYAPQAAPLIGDIYASLQDWPRADEVAQRLELLLPPEVRRQKAIKEAEGRGETLPPDDPRIAQPQPPQPSPEDVANAQVAEAKAKEAEINLQIAQTRLAQEQVKLAQLRQREAVPGQSE